MSLDGGKFKTIFEALKADSRIHFMEPDEPASTTLINSFLSNIMRYRVQSKNGLFKALESPRIPFIPLSVLERKVLSPMRWGVAGTLLGAREALNRGGVFWNLSGGYHHATPQNMEGFCIYNDIGICYQQLIQEEVLTPDDKILIIDTDAHHGNGNAYIFRENPQITILDVYNAGISAMAGYSRHRVDIPVLLAPGTGGEIYLKQYSKALQKLGQDYRLAFVIAGTDTLSTDKRGRLALDIKDIAEREKLTLTALKERAIPTVVLGGGGYSKDSAQSVIQAISSCVESGLGR